MAESKNTTKQKLGTSFALVAIALIIILPVILFVPISSHSHGPSSKACISATQITTACVSYWTEYGSMPETTENARLREIITGDNPRKIEFILLKARDLNPKGEMIDPWGTPFQIKFESESKVHVISAGPDKVFGTPDDIGN